MFRITYSMVGASVHSSARKRKNSLSDGVNGASLAEVCVASSNVPTLARYLCVEIVRWRRSRAIVGSDILHSPTTSSSRVTQTLHPRVNIDTGACQLTDLLALFNSATDVQPLPCGAREAITSHSFKSRLCDQNHYLECVK